MRTNNVSFIFLLVFLKNVTSQPKLFVVDLISKETDDNHQIKLNKALELVRDENQDNMQGTLYRGLDKYVKKILFAKNNEFDSDESEMDYNEQESFKEDICQSLRPKDIRACVKNNLKKIKSKILQIEMGGAHDVFKNFKTPDECVALDTTVYIQLQCLEKFENKPTDNKILEFSESEEDEFVNPRKPEDCWNLKNTRMSKKLICLQKLHDKHDETNDDELKNVKDPNDCLFLKKSSMHTKFKCLEMLEKKKVPEAIIEYDNFENIKDPNECLFLKQATMKNKLQCLEKFENKTVEVNDVELENVKDPTDCLSLKTTIKNKYKCLDKFGKANDDNEIAVPDDDFDNLKEPNECLFLQETILIKLKCLDKFQKVEDKAIQKAKEMTILTPLENNLRTKENNDIKGPEDCLFASTSYGTKLKCLDQFEKSKDSFRSRSIESNHQFIAARPKRKIYSLYNYYNAVVKPGYKDLTRQEFSQDYLDISELSRSIPKCRTPECNLDLLKLSYKLKDKKPDHINNSRRIFDRVHTRYIQSDTDDDSDEIEAPKPTKRKVQKKKNGLPIRFAVVSKDEKPKDSESDEHMGLKAENEESVEDSEEEHQNLKKKKKKKSPKKKPKVSAEEIDKKSFMLFESEEDVNKELSSESVLSQESSEKNTKKKAKKAKKSHVDDDYSIETERPSSFKYAYLQGNNVVDFIRRRLEHFLPKRVHWDEADFKNLGYHWHEGPKGKWSN